MTIVFVQKKKRPGSKLKSNTPLLFGIDEASKKKLKELPRKALELFKQNKGTSVAWETLMFRVRSAYEMAVHLYVSQTQDELKVISDLLELSFSKQTNQDHWILDIHELEQAELALDAMDAMQDECTRKEMLEPFLKTRTFMNRFAF